MIQSDTSNPLLKLGIYDIANLRKEIQQAAQEPYLVEGFVAQQSLSLAVGDSNLGKSPFLYQLALSVASGKPFLSMPVKQGPVLYMDAENSPLQVAALVTTLADYLGLPDVPANLLLYNKNNCPGGYGLAELVKAAQPRLVILDPIYAWYPHIEGSAENVTAAYGELRSIMKDNHCAVMGVHHPGKESNDPKAPARERLESVDVHKWLARARGSSALINGCDHRLAFDRPVLPGDCKLVVGGFTRVLGSLPLVRLARDLDADGEPRGYRRLGGVDLLKPAWQAVYQALPEVFRFKDVKPHFDDKSDATAKFLNACVAADVLDHDLTVKPKGAYRKKVAPSAAEEVAA